MNHLEEAKSTLAQTPSKSTDEHAIAHALIAIAEQLQNIGQYERKLAYNKGYMAAVDNLEDK